MFREWIKVLRLEDQELYFPGAVFAGHAYWKGAVDLYVNGTLSPTSVGNVELTGYAQATASTQ
jgi:hypothetical protein